MSDPTNQGAQRLKRVSPYSAPPSASTVAVAPTLTARSQVSSSVRAMLPPVRIGRIGASVGFGVARSMFFYIAMNAGRLKDLSNSYNGPAWEYRCSEGLLPSSRWSRLHRQS
jgi:hypothetical protein